MTRSMLAALLTVGLLLSLFQITSAEPSDEKAIHDVLEARVAAQFDSDFPRLASLLHVSTQRLFRDLLSARFDELLRVYSFKQISTVSGLPTHPRDLQLSDPEFFIFTCQRASERHPDFVGDPKILPLDIRETVFHGDGRVDVALSCSRHVQTERTDFSFFRPFVIVLQREQSKWEILSCPLADTIAYNWSRDLAYAAPQPR